MYRDLAGKNVLLLQGPVGPFFRRLASDLSDSGAIVTKVNLNAGDRLFYLGKPAVAYRGRSRDWPGFIERLMRAREIDVVFLFGDGRPYHRIASAVARKLGISVCVFEEGYLRPDYITMEANGVNGRSQMPRDPMHYRRWSLSRLKPTIPVGKTFFLFALYATFYALAHTFCSWCYPYYKHHRDIHAFRQMVYWIRAGWRKVIYKYQERPLIDLLTTRWSNKYYLLPLQVYNDSQLQHSDFPDIETLIREVVSSFSEEASAETLLVIKHHPLDRGYRDYTALVKSLAERHGLHGRLLYVHDLHLPTLLKNARGTVVMNSTVGLSSIYHNTPVKVLGRAIYNLPGLTYQHSLAKFWNDTGKIDRDTYHNFQGWLRINNQANGSFYRRLRGAENKAGIGWFSKLPQCSNVPEDPSIGIDKGAIPIVVTNF
jgi:capsule polysaccharide modification protein KpsS